MPSETIPEHAGRRLAEGVARRIGKPTETGCWPWLGARNQHGYGRWGEKPRRAAHRVVYEAVVGPIPDELHLDHLCRNHCCVNPDHLEPVTSRENTMRGVGLTAQLARKTHCKKGHELSGDNVAIRTTNGFKFRRCRECHKIAMHDYHRRTRG